MEMFEASSVWMLAMGKTILHSIWIGMLILALHQLAQTIVPAKYSRLRYGISVSTLLLLFVSVLATFLLIYEPALSMQDLSGLRGKNLSGRENILFPITGAAADKAGFLLTLAGYIYFTGLLFMLLRSANSLIYIRDLQKSGQEPPPEWQERFEKLKESLGIRRTVDFFVSNLVSAPQLASFLKPAVLVPAGMLSNLPVNQIETILIHELYHLKRRDYLVNILQLFIEGALFYHPATWIISGSIRREREHCCDDGVLSFTDNPLNYAKALIQIAEKQHFTRLSPGAIGSEKHQFYSRIKRILNQNTMKTNLRDKVLTLALLAGSLILLLSISGFRAAPSPVQHDKQSTGALSLLAETIKITVPDTIPEEGSKEEIEKELEVAREEALKEIEEIDWEELKAEMEVAREEALKEIEEIDWEELTAEMEVAREKALKEVEEIDWEELKAEMEINMEELKLDMEEMRMEIENSMQNIDWDEIKEDIKQDLDKARIYLDSIKIEMDL
jgi:beta-lactamase regulating signal transducer with metallopeptidase domain